MGPKPPGFQPVQYELHSPKALPHPADTPSKYSSKSAHHMYICPITVDAPMSRTTSPDAVLLCLSSPTLLSTIFPTLDAKWDGRAENPAPVSKVTSIRFQPGHSSESTAADIAERAHKSSAPWLVSSRAAVPSSP
eukprot:1697883-Amphidinium_carterae.1